MAGGGTEVSVADTRPDNGPDTAGGAGGARDATAPSLLAVDGNSLGHRAFHSTRDDPDPAHAVTGAVVSMLASAWIHGPYDGLLVAFDHPVNNRKLDHPEYKANRDATDPDLRVRLVQLREDLDEAGITVVEEHGAEADDLLAAAADACLERGWACDLLSSDRDLTALVGPDIRLLRPKATFADLVVEDVAQVRRSYGIEPHQYTDLAALRGDPSDGLDGVTGIGPRIAARLLRDHGSVLGIYDVLLDLPPKLEAALRAGRERVERNLLLMAPVPHLSMDVEVVLQRGIDLDRLEPVLTGFGQARAARRLRRAVTSPPPPPLPPAPPDPDPPARSRPVQRDVAAPQDGEQEALF